MRLLTKPSAAEVEEAILYSNEAGGGGGGGDTSICQSIEHDSVAIDPSPDAQAIYRLCKTFCATNPAGSCHPSWPHP